MLVISPDKKIYLDQKEIWLNYVNVINADQEFISPKKKVQHHVCKIVQHIQLLLTLQAWYTVISPDSRCHRQHHIPASSEPGAQTHNLFTELSECSYA